MKKESEPRKRSITAAIAASGIQAVVYTADRHARAELTAREACLNALIEDAARMSQRPPGPGAGRFPPWVRQPAAHRTHPPPRLPRVTDL